MGIFMVIGLAGGLAFFIYGMNTMSSGLQKLAGSRLEGILAKMTANRFKALLLGIMVTAAIQSSTAVTVMLVGLVNSGLMRMGQTIGVIMGANVGTTVTAWLLSLIGIEGENPVLNLLKPENFSPVLAFVGILLIMMGKRQKHKDLGSILMGFAILMFGMELMSEAVSPLKDMPQFGRLLVAFRNPFLGILAGALLTAVVQSSSASMGILQALTLTGSITYAVAIPIIMGQNIGTCMTALLSSIGVNRNAKKVSVVHVSFNVIGTLAGLAVYYGAGLLARVGAARSVGPFLLSAATPVGTATVHSIFNVATTILLLPFTKQLEQLANRIIKEEEQEAEPQLLDTRLLVTPAVAVAECRKRTEEMTQTAFAAVSESLTLFTEYGEEKVAEILRLEDRLDLYEDKIGKYLLAIDRRRVSGAGRRQKNIMLRVIGDLERIGDHAVSLLHSAEEMQEKGMHFSNEAAEEIVPLQETIRAIMKVTEEAFARNDMQTGGEIHVLGERMARLIEEAKSNHIERLQNSQCTIRMGFVWMDILTSLQRIAAHCFNICGYVDATVGTRGF